MNKLHTALQKSASYGWQSFKFQVSLRLPSLKSTTSEVLKSASVASLEYCQEDNISKFLYPTDAPPNLTPVSIYGDGNCFFRALSLAIFGHEERHLEIRTVCELVVNMKAYLSVDTYNKMCSDKPPTGVQYIIESSVSDDCYVPRNIEKSLQNEIMKSIGSSKGGYIVSKGG